MKEADVKKVAEFIDRALLAKGDKAALLKIRDQAFDFNKSFPRP